MASKTPPASSGSVSAIARLQLRASGNGDEVVRRSIKPDNGADGGADGQTVHAPDGHPGIFCDKEGRPRVLRGVTVYSGAPRLAELAGLIGFETVWIEMEHGPTDYALAEHICMAAEVAGAIPTIRVS